MLPSQKNKSKKIIYIFLLIIFSIPSVFSLFHKGFFQSDDGEWMVIRFSAFHEVLRSGQFPVRFLNRLNFGYGYPVANFLYPGFMYLGEIIHLIGLNFTDTVKAIFLFSMVGSSIFTFLWLNKIFDYISSFVGSLVYLYLPYHLYDLYKRGSVGEILALLFVPLILLAIEKGSFLLMATGIFFLIISHNTLALFFIPLLFIYSLLSGKIDVVNSILAFITGALLSSFFSLPAILELSLTVFSKTKVADFSNYFASADVVGLVGLAVLLVSLYVFYKEIKQKIVNTKVVFFLMTAIISLFLSLKSSLLFWNLLPSSIIQFPFRFLSFFIVAISFLAAYILYFYKKIKSKFILFLFFIIIFFISSYSYIKPSLFTDKQDSFYYTNEATTTVQDEYMPRWVKVKPSRHFDEKVEILEGKAKLDNPLINPRQNIFNIFLLDKEAKIRINTIYYPGWQILVDGKVTTVDFKNKFGVMDFFIHGQGEHNIKLIFKETPLRLLADMFSFIGLLFLVIFSFKYKNKQI